MLSIKLKNLQNLATRQKNAFDNGKRQTEKPYVYAKICKANFSEDVNEISLRHLTHVPVKLWQLLLI